jgi:protoporphyrinogen oxidase
MGGNIVTDAPVDHLIATPNEGIELTTARGRFHFDQVVATIPSRRFLLMASQLTQDYARKLSEVKYLGVVCFVLLLKRQLSPYYVLNLTDEGLPFTGVIEMTNLISRSETSGYHLVYLPKYTVPGDPLFNTPESELWPAFRNGLRRVYPDLQDSDIEARHLFRERLVQPIPVLNYSDIVPEMRTNIDGVFLANTTQIINSNLNNNAMVKIANRAVQLVLEKYRETRPPTYCPVSDATPIEAK